MTFCFLSPGEFTGGPLAIHQAAASLRQMGVDASILYVNSFELAHGEFAFGCEGSSIHVRQPKMPKKWKFWKKRPETNWKPVQIDPRLGKFNVPRAEVAPRDAHFVVPEVWPDLASALLRHGCENVHFWWLSVDNFPLTSLHQLVNQKLIRTCSNLCQCEYAADFARSQGAQDVSMLTDFIDMKEVETPKPLDARTYDICYLPNKARGAEALWEVLSQDFNIIPLQNMDRAEIEATLNDCKIFLDCGFHPGKDRVPREAALCGCLPVVRKAGAARFKEDVPLPDELLLDTELFFQPEQMRQKLHQILAAPARFDQALDAYRDIISKERAQFDAELTALAEMAEPKS